MRGGRKAPAPRRSLVSWQLVFVVLLGVAVLRTYILNSQLESGDQAPARGRRGKESNLDLVARRTREREKEKEKEREQEERRKRQEKRRVVFDGLEEDFLPQRKKGPKLDAFSSAEIDSESEEGGVWKGESMNDEEEADQDIHMAHFKDKALFDGDEDPAEASGQASRRRSRRGRGRSRGGAVGEGRGDGAEGGEEAALAPQGAPAAAHGGERGRGGRGGDNDRLDNRLVKPVVVQTPEEKKAAAKEAAKGAWDRYMSENVRKQMIDSVHEDRRARERHAPRGYGEEAEEAEEGSLGAAEALFANLDLVTKLTVQKTGRAQGGGDPVVPGGGGGGGGGGLVPRAHMRAVDPDEVSPDDLADDGGLTDELGEAAPAEGDDLAGGNDLAGGGGEGEYGGGTEVEPGDPDVNADFGREQRLKVAGRRRGKRGEEDVIYIRDKDGHLIKKPRDNPKYDSAAYQCKHLENCDRWTAKNNKLKAQQHEEEEVLRRRQERRDKSARAWGLQVASSKPLELACRFKDPPLPEAAPREEGEEGAVGAVTGGRETKKSRAGVVRACTRAVMRSVGLGQDAGDERMVRTLVQLHLGVELTSSLRGVLHDEVARLQDQGSASAAREGFQLAHTQRDPRSRPRGITPEEAGLEARRMRRDNPTELEALAMRARHSWASRSAAAEQFDRLLWAQMSSTHTHVVVGGSQYDRVHPGVRARVARRSTSGGVFSLEDATREADEGVEPPLPLVTHQRQFLPESEEGVFPDDLDPSELRPTLEVTREGSVGSATHHYRFPPELLELLPREDRTWRYKTCAVVGNSGALLRGARRGGEIDANEAVFRINYPPTKGFERMVGERTSFDMINLQHTKQIVQGKTTPTRLLNSTILVFEVTNSFARRHLYADLLRQYSGSSLEDAHVAILAPELVGHAHHVWMQTKGQIEAVRFSEFNDTRVYHRKPMTGYFAVMFALQVCEHVNLYGFTRYTGSARDQRYHYFDTEKASLDVHSFDLSYEVFRQLAVWPDSDAYLRITMHR